MRWMLVDNMMNDVVADIEVVFRADGDWSLWLLYDEDERSVYQAAKVVEE